MFGDTERSSKVRLVQKDPVYAAMIEQLDSAIGRVLEAVETNGLADNTVVVFMSDNGGPFTAEGQHTSMRLCAEGKAGLTRAVFVNH